MSSLYEMYEKVQELKSNGIDIIEMNVGDPDIKSEEVIKNIKESVCEENLCYCSAKGEQRLIDKIKEVFGIEKEVVIIPGSKFGIYEILYLNRNKKTLLLEPGWSAYEMMLKEFRTKYKKVSLDPFEMCVDLKELKDVEFLILNNPNNPTSKKISNLDEILDYCNKNNIIILYDAAYEDLVYDNKKIDPNDVDYYVYSFSKSFGISGARIGFLTCNDEKDFVKLNQMTISCVPKFIQVGLTNVLDKKNKIVKEISYQYKERSDYAHKILSEKFDTPKPEAPFYTFPKVGKDFDCLELLEEKKVSVVPGDAFGDDYSEYIRISLSGNKWKEGLKRIVDFD